MASYMAVGAVADEALSRRMSLASTRSGRSIRSAPFAGQASWISSVINLVNTIVGAGCLAMPSALSNMGILLGTFVILWAGLTAGFGLYLQIRCSRYLERGTASFFGLSQMTYPNAAVLFDAAIAVKCFGVGVSYLIIIGDLMPGVVRGFSDTASEIGFLVDRQFWVTGFMLVVIPLSFLRRLDSLKYTSFIALVSIAYLVILVLAHFFKGDTMTERGDVHVFTWAGAVPALASFPVTVFAYTCHQNMFSVLNEIKDNSHKRTLSVVITSIGGAACLYILVAITGYLSFGDKVGGNIVSMYPASVSATIGRAAIVVLVMFSYPLQVHPCRASVDAVLKWRPHRRNGAGIADNSPSRSAPLLGGGSSASSLHNGSQHSGSSRDSRYKAAAKDDLTMSDLRFAILSTAIIVLSYIVAMTVTSLEKVLAYVGSTGSTSISFILPGLFYYKISSPDSPHHQRLMKMNDDETLNEYDGDGNDDGAGVGDEEGGAAGFLLGLTRGRKPWARSMLRKASLALALYGVVVMLTCLVTNTIFVVSD